MDILGNIKEKFSTDGFAIVEDIFSNEEVDNLLSCLSQVDTSKPTFRKTKDLFAIRQFFKEVPEAVDLIFNDKLNALIFKIFGNEYSVVKSIYFDKPEESNWFVSYHQDLTISVDKKLDIDGYGPWTSKQDQFAVQPPLSILQDNFTIRIHLDNTNKENGALKVIPGSHLRGIYRTESIDWAAETKAICEVRRGGIMFMKPLLLHSSARTLNKEKRRVIHIEFSRIVLPGDLNWAELLSLKAVAS